MIGLVDGNNFFVSCERVFDPSLEGKPVAVLSNNDGCCISRSNEFKALNIAMGTPYFQLRDLEKKYGLIFRSSNYELYGDLSRRIISILYEFSPDVEQYSIDEAFIHMTEPATLPQNKSLHQYYSELGRVIRSTILQWIGIPCGVGFAPSKTLAKIANHIGKKSPEGVFVMPEDPEGILANLPVSEVWGVGRRLAPKLERWGIRTAWKLACADESFLRKNFNITLAKTSRELRGENLFEQEETNALSKSITCSRSFGQAVTALEDLTQAVCSYAATGAEKLRKEQQTASGMNIYYQYYPEYSPSPLPGGCTAITVIFPEPTNHTRNILSFLTPHLKGIFIAGRRYKKAGIIYFGLESTVNFQGDLFADHAKEERDSNLSAALDLINKKYGRKTLFHLSEGIEKPWAMKRNMLTKHYTTSWDELPEVK